jgi:hypothetical protein
MLRPKDLSQNLVIVCDPDEDPKATFTVRPFSVAERNAFSDKLRALPVDAKDQRSLADIHGYYREIVKASLVAVENVVVSASASTTSPSEAMLNELSEIPCPVAGFTSFLVWLGSEIWKKNNPTLEKKTSGSPA